MAFNPGEFVFQPRPLQQFDFGSGFRDLANARLQRQGLDNQSKQAAASLQEQQAVRTDTNTRYSAGLAADRNDAEYARAQEQYKKGVLYTDAARKAVASGDWNSADALAGRITELGGKVNKTMGPNGRPIYEFQAPQEPGRQPIDFAGMRGQIFPGQSRQSGPFQVPGFGTGGQRNPFDSLPGASAAAVPQAPPVDAAGPPPGPAVDAAGPPPGPAIDGAPPRPPEPAPPPPPAAPQAAAQAPQAQPGNLQLTPPNPFDPFKLDTSQLIAQNESRLNPYLEGAKKGVPAEYQSRLDTLNDSVAGLGLPLEDSLKLYQPTFNTLAGLMKSDISADATRASMGMRGQNMEFTQNQRLRDFAARRVNAIQTQYDTKAEYKRYNQIYGLNKLLDEGAKGNGQSDVLAISNLRNMYQDGIMTDKDFEDVKGGIRTVWQQIKDGTIENLLHNGINPDSRANLRAIVRIANARSERSLTSAQNAMMTRVINDRTIADEERQEYINATAEMIPNSLWSPELREYMGIPMEQKSGPLDQSGNFKVGNGPSAATTGANASVSKSHRGKGKPVKDMTDAEVKKELDGLLE
jgi:hypothetical protein